MPGDGIDVFFWAEKRRQKGIRKDTHTHTYTCSPRETVRKKENVGPVAVNSGTRMRSKQPFFFIVSNKIENLSYSKDLRFKINIIFIE